MKTLVKLKFRKIGVIKEGDLLKIARSIDQKKIPKKKLTERSPTNQEEDNNASHACLQTRVPE